MTRTIGARDEARSGPSGGSGGGSGGGGYHTTTPAPALDRPTLRRNTSNSSRPIP